MVYVFMHNNFAVKRLIQELKDESLISIATKNDSEWFVYNNER